VNVQPGVREAVQDAAAGPGAGPRGRRLITLAAWTLLTLAAFAAYLQLARTRAVNSDGAGQALQAWDMLHGNPLLRGWRLSDVSFYTTELPQYMLVELAHGLNAGAVHIAAAMTYTLAVLFAALLAKGTATGREGVFRACLAAGIMLAPQLDDGTNVLISSPDHIGTSVPVLLILLILDRAGRRWYVPVVVSLLLGWAVVADTLVLYVAVIPVALVCGYRVCRELLARRSMLWWEGALGIGALVCGAAAVGVLRLIHAAGGFYVGSPNAHVAPLGTIIGKNLRLTGEGVLLLCGANFINLRSGIDYAFAALHLVGVAIVAAGFLLTLWRWRRADLVDQVLAIGVILNLAAYAVSTSAVFLPTTREFAPVLPLSAALAARRLGPPLARSFRTSRWSPLAVSALALVGLGYLAGLAHEAVQPAVPPQDARLTTWLAAHHLTDGLSGYWEANVVPLTSGNQVRIRLVGTGDGRFAPGSVETNMTWYDPSRYTANFVVIFPGIHGYPGFTSEREALATFGAPARVYHTGRYTILVWNKNLLSQLIPSS
jgi:hypothetical protein